MFDITAAGYTQPELPDLEFVRIEAPGPKSVKEKFLNGITLKLGLFEKYYWNNISVISAHAQLRGCEFDIILANDISSLPLAILLAKDTDAKVMIDCHEYTPREFEGHFIFSFFLEKYYDYLCKTYLPEADIKTTVCWHIADEYEKKYGGAWQVITNAPFYKDLQPSSINKDEIRMLHHGNLSTFRNIEKMIKLVDLLESRFHLDFMLVNNNPSYYEKLLNLAKNNPRINFRDPVPMAKVLSTINNYDIGLYLLPPIGFNNQMALPNKFFEFIQARLALAIWPSPEMGKISREYKCGVVSDDFSLESMAKALNALSNDDIMHYKMNSDKAARTLCAEKNGELLRQLLHSLFN